jgi:hypothetical protein
VEQLITSLQGLAVKAVRGDALLFYSLKPNGEEDPTSMHGSCPTLKVWGFLLERNQLGLSVMRGMQMPNPRVACWVTIATRSGAAA